MGHQRLHVLQGHPFLDGPLHPDQTHPVLVFHQFSDRPYPPVAEVVDIVNRSLAVLQPDQVLDRFDNVLLGQGPLVDVDIEAKLGIDLVPSDLGEIVQFRVEEQVMEKALGNLEGRRTRRPKSAIDLQQGFLG